MRRLHQAALTAVLATMVILPLWAQRQMNVAQLEAFIRNSIQQKQSDKQVADTLKNFRMSERLDPSRVETLQGLGAGPRTLEELRKMSAASAALAAAAPPAPPAPELPQRPAPSQAEQDRALAAITKYALDYTKNLPDFICTQVTRRYVDPGNRGNFRPSDEIQEQLSYVDDMEHYKVVMVNRQIVNGLTHEQLGGAISRGEFGTRLYEIFRPESHTAFVWERWASLRGRRMHVFAFRVKQQDSAFTVADEASGRSMIAGYHGTVYADAQTNAVMRIQLELDGLQNFPIRRVGSTLDYDYVDISGQQFVLPFRAELVSAAFDYGSRNEVRFQLYSKFSADAVITYDVPDEIPEDQLEEQPAK